MSPKSPYMYYSTCWVQCRLRGQPLDILRGAWSFIAKNNFFHKNIHCQQVLLKKYCSLDMQDFWKTYVVKFRFSCSTPHFIKTNLCFEEVPENISCLWQTSSPSSPWILSGGCLMLPGRWTGRCHTASLQTRRGRQSEQHAWRTLPREDMCQQGSWGAVWRQTWWLMTYWCPWYNTWYIEFDTCNVMVVYSSKQRRFYRTEWKMSWQLRGRIS